MKWGYIELRKPYESWDDPEVKKIFCEMITLKKAGYDNKYRFSLPVDTFDLISDHYLVWHEVDGHRIIVSGLRSITAKTLQKYKLESPPLSLLQTISTVTDISLHLSFFEKKLKEFKSTPEKVGFYNGWTVLPRYSGQGELSCLFSRAAVATIPLSQESYIIPIMFGSAMPHLGTNKILMSMGYKAWPGITGELPALPSPGYDMQKTVFIYGTADSPDYQEKLTFFRRFWDRREIIGDQVSDKKKMAA